MYKLFLLLAFTTTIYAQKLVDIYLLKSTSSYILKDGDIVFDGDKITFDIKSDQKIKTYYQIDDERKEVLEIKEGENLVIDGHIGVLTFIFELKNITEKIKFYTNPNFVDSTSDDILKNNFHSSKRVYINQQKVITNDRGQRESNIIIPKLESSTVIINSGGKIGAGVIIKNGKYVLTNYHVIEPDIENIYIALKQKNTYRPSKASYYKVKVLKVDMLKDLALLELPIDLVKSKNVSFLELGNIKDIKKGMDIFNMGHPLGYFYAFEYGMLNNILDDYSWTIHKAKKVLQYSMNSNRGNSGSPVINEKLELIGIGAFSNTKGNNLNFAISIEDIKEFLNAKEDVRFKKISPDGYKGKIIQEGLYKNIRFAKIDRNGNGVPDAMMKDFDKDGKWDVIAYDTDEDGSYERVTSF